MAGGTSGSSTDDSVISGNTESRMQKAIVALNLGLHKNVKAAATAFNVKYGTFRNRYLGKHKPARAAHEKQQLLDPNTETALISWCKYRAKQGEALTHEALLRYATELAGKTPGSKWVKRFLVKHSDQLEAGKARGLDPKRAQAFTRPVVEDYFKKLEETLKIYNIPPENIYNEDEKGVQMGGGRKALKTQFIFPRGMKNKIVKRADTLQIVTVLEAVAADGTSVSPVIVLPKNGQPSEWWKESRPHGLGGLVNTPNGWTDNQVYLDWFTHVFIPHAKARNTSGTKILLISDGHKSHETSDLLKAAYRNQILLFSLPPHTTDRLQPLDVGVFGPLQNAYSRRSQIVASEGVPIGCEPVIEEYLAVRNKSMTAKVILSAFKKTGIHPFNADLFGEDDYTLSGAWAVSDRGPEGFPYILSSDDSAMSMSSDRPPGGGPRPAASEKRSGRGAKRNGGATEEEEEDDEDGDEDDDDDDDDSDEEGGEPARLLPYDLEIEVLRAATIVGYEDMAILTFRDMDDISSDSEDFEPDDADDDGMVFEDAVEDLTVSVSSVSARLPGSTEPVVPPPTELDVPPNLDQPANDAEAAQSAPGSIVPLDSDVAASISSVHTHPAPPDSDVAASISSVHTHTHTPSTQAPSSRSHSYHTQSVGRQKLSPYQRPPSRTPSSSHASSTRLNMATDEVRLLREENAQQKVEYEAALERERHACEVAEERLHTAEANQRLAEVFAHIHKVYADDLRVQVKGPKKACKVNINARLLTCPEAEEEWEQAQAVEAARLAEQKQKADEQSAATRARTTLRIQNTVFKMFDLPLHQYKHKDDLRDIALALALDDGGRKEDLQLRIKAHLEAHPETKANPRFVALYIKKRERGSRQATTASSAPAPLPSQPPSQSATSASTSDNAPPAPSQVPAPAPSHVPAPAPSHVPAPAPAPSHGPTPAVPPRSPSRLAPSHVHAASVRPRDPTPPFFGAVVRHRPESVATSPYPLPQALPSFGAVLGSVADMYAHLQYGTVPGGAAHSAAHALPREHLSPSHSSIASALGVSAPGTNIYGYGYTQPQPLYVQPQPQPLYFYPQPPASFDGTLGEGDHAYGTQSVTSAPDAAWGYSAVSGSVGDMNVTGMYVPLVVSPTMSHVAPPSFYHPFSPHPSHPGPSLPGPSRLSPSLPSLPGPPSTRSDPVRRGSTHPPAEGYAPRRGF